MADIEIEYENEVVFNFSTFLIIVNTDTSEWYIEEETEEGEEVIELDTEDIKNGNSVQIDNKTIDREYIIKLEKAIEKLNNN